VVVQVILPLFNERTFIASHVAAVLAALTGAGYEARVLLVDDGSSDGSGEVAAQLSAEDSRVRYISFSRNFGKEAALMAGLAEAEPGYDVIAYMDSDGQHAPADLVRLVQEADSNDVDLVCGVRVDRNYQTPVRRWATGVFYGLFRLLTGSGIDPRAGDFNVLRPNVAEALLSLTEEHPFVKGLVAWVGFRRVSVPITIRQRGDGRSQSGILGMLRLAVGAVLSFSSWPLRAWSVLGAVWASLGLLYLVVVVVDTTINGRAVPGYASTIVLLLGFGGLQMLSIGVVGEYVARIYDASKGRPRYIIARRSPPNGD